MTQASRSNDWRNPPKNFARWNAIYGFTVDAAASKWNAQLPRYWTKAMDAFKQNPTDERPYWNPPYSKGNLDRFMDHAREQVQAPVAQLWGNHVPGHTAEGWFTRTVMRAPPGEPLLRVEDLSLPGFANGYRRVYRSLAIDLWFYEGRVTHTNRAGQGDGARFPNAFVVFAQPRHLPDLRNHVRPTWTLAG